MVPRQNESGEPSRKLLARKAVRKKRLKGRKNRPKAESGQLSQMASTKRTVGICRTRAGAGNSRVFELRAPMMAKGRYDDVTMKISVWDKDMQVIGDYARKIRVPTPIFNATKGIYLKAMKSGLGSRDTAAVCAVLEKMAKVRRKNPRAR